MFENFDTNILLLKGIIVGMIMIIILMMICYTFILIEFDKIKKELKILNNHLGSEKK